MELPTGTEKQKLEALHHALDTAHFVAWYLTKDAPLRDIAMKACTKIFDLMVEVERAAKDHMEDMKGDEE